MLDKKAVEVSEQEFDEHFQAGYGIFAGPARYRARLRFTPERAQWVSKEVWHHDQSSSFESDGSYVLEVPYSSGQELVMDLLRHSPEVEVLAPAELRQSLSVALCAAALKNQPAPVN